MFSTKEKLREESNFFLKKRGPDETKYFSNLDFFSIHNLLSVTGNKTTQPYIEDNIYVLFNGEIYNDKKQDQCDTVLIPKIYKKHKEKFYNYLDGEFSLVLYDKNINKIFFCRDVFGTKPLYFSTLNGLVVASLKSAFYDFKTPDVFKAAPNTLYSYDISSKKLDIFSNQHKFNLVQKKNTLNDFHNALENSVIKRLPKINYCIGVSSGIDSGILSLISHKNSNCNLIFIENNENKEILNKRYSFFKNKLFKTSINLKEKIKFRNILIEKSEPLKFLSYNYFNDSSSICLSLIGDYCNNKNIKVFISGTGSDELYSDYGFNGKKFTENSCFGGRYPVKLESVFPWKNVFSGTMSNYLEKDEKILGSFGLETRYPFLDKKLFQEFLWLNNKIKNRGYKYCLTSYLKKHNFPFSYEKRGFSCETS